MSSAASDVYKRQSGERAGGGQESEGGQLHGVGRKLDFGVQMSGCNVHPTFTCCY